VCYKYCYSLYYCANPAAKEMLCPRFFMPFFKLQLKSTLTALGFPPLSHTHSFISTLSCQQRILTAYVLLIPHTATRLLSISFASYCSSSIQSRLLSSCHRQVELRLIRPCLTPLVVTWNLVTEPIRAVQRGRLDRPHRGPRNLKRTMLLTGTVLMIQHTLETGSLEQN
jgi:hypothetical protein